MRHKAPSSVYLSEKGIAPELMEKYRRLGAEGLDTGSLESAYTSHTITSRILLEKARQRRGHAQRSNDDKNAAKPEG